MENSELFGGADGGAMAMQESTDAVPLSQWDMHRLLQQKDILLREMQHRTGNSLQIVASILLLKARSVQSEEARLHLRDAHGRVMSVAAVQKQLQLSQGGERVDLGLYLSELCESLGDSMIGGARTVSLNASAPFGGSAASADAVCIGLIVTELVVNALKHAFAQDGPDNRIDVVYENGRSRWCLSVSDNGGGMSAGAKPKPGLGTGIIEALAGQLQSRVHVVSDARGHRTMIVHDVFG